MDARTELANILDDHMSERDYDQGCRPWCGYTGNARDEHLADAILAAGYRKVDIVSQEFLDSLPDEAPGLLAAVKEVRERLAKDGVANDPE